MLRLIVFIIVAVLLVFFIGFNLPNICNISIIFHTFENVHVVMPVLISFLLGILIMVPFVLAARGGVKKVRKENKEAFEKMKEDSKSKFASKKAEKKKFKSDKTSATDTSKTTEPKVEIIHPEGETEYVPAQHLDAKVEKPAQE